MTNSEYKNYVSDICNRIIKDKLINIVKDRDSKSVVFKIQINPVEWYIELDDDLKFNVEYNLQHLFKPLIIEAINDYNKEKEEKEESEEKEEREEKEEEKKFLSNCSKRQKT